VTKIILLFLLLIPFQLSATVFTKQQWINFYLRGCSTVSINAACKQKLEKSLGKMIEYRGMILRHLKKEQLPLWFIIIPIVESDYNERAVSPASATGMWQIMPYNIEAYLTKKIVFLNNEIELTPTSARIRKYGFDPKVSTQIATLHLSKLFLIYRDRKDCEKLSLMAYNAGTKRVNSWLLGKSKLPDETQNYYNKIMAVKYIIRNMKRLSIEPDVKVTLFDRIKRIVTR